MRADDLAALVMKKIAERNKLDPALIDEVYLGCVNQTGEDSCNVARMASLRAGYPDSVPAVTVNRLCASGLEAAACALRAIMAGDGQCYVAGGVESMTRASLTAPIEGSGEAAENVAAKWKIKRELQDQFAQESHQKAILAQAAGYFKDEILPVEVPQRNGEPLIVDNDEQPRAETTLEHLAALKPILRASGTVTAGNSAAPSDGAAALLICTENFAAEHGLKPLVKIAGSAAVGVDPRETGSGPVLAVEKLLQRTGRSKFEIGLWEINEAFAAQSLAALAELDPPLDRVNVWGGAIAIGHPPGMSGARLLGTLAHQMRRFSVKYGVATLSTDCGQGQALLLEAAD